MPAGHPRSVFSATDRQQTVVACDDDHAVRDLLARLVEAEPGLRLVGDAADGVSAERLVLAERPDVVVMDLGLPERPGEEVIASLRACGFRGRIIVFSGSAPRVSVLLRLGADVLVRKGDVAGLLAELRAAASTPAAPVAA